MGLVSNGRRSRMKKKTGLLLSFTILFLAIIFIRLHEHGGLVHPDKSVWKTLTPTDWAIMDTALVNSYWHKGLVHRDKAVWKVLVLDDPNDSLKESIQKAL